jgi:hypothetical protein
LFFKNTILAKFCEMSIPRREKQKLIMGGVNKTPTPVIELTKDLGKQKKERNKIKISP